jgi:hypothetical protein
MSRLDLTSIIKSFQSTKGWTRTATGKSRAVGVGDYTIHVEVGLTERQVTQKFGWKYKYFASCRVFKNGSRVAQSEAADNLKINAVTRCVRGAITLGVVQAGGAAIRNEKTGEVIAVVTSEWNNPVELISKVLLRRNGRPEVLIPRATTSEIRELIPVAVALGYHGIVEGPANFEFGAY